LNGLLTLRSGDDNFFESVCGFSGLRLRQLHARQADQPSASHKQQFFFSHIASPYS
jgi:hypothetical protein